MKFRNTLVWLSAFSLVGCGVTTPVQNGGSQVMDSNGSSRSSIIPSADKHCKDVAGRLQHPDNSAGVMFSDDCGTVFLLPPVKGRAEVTSMSPSLMLERCPALRDASAVANNTIASARIISERIKTALEGSGSIQEEVQRSKTEMDLAVEKRRLAESNFAPLTIEMESKKLEAKQAKDAYDECADGGDGGCEELKTAWDAAKQARDEFRSSSFRPAENALAESKLDVLQKQSDYQRVSTNWTAFVSPLMDLQNQLLTLQESIDRVVTPWMAVEGATAQVVYSIPWDELLQGYNEKNPNAGVLFSRMRVIDGTIEASTTTYDKERGAFAPIVLSSEIPGLAAHGTAHLPDGNVPAPTDSNGPQAPSQNQDAVFNGALHSISAKLTLSMLGACPFYPDAAPGVQLVGRAVSQDELAANVVVNARLTYQVQADRGYTAKYNSYQMIEKIERQSRRKGFFSSKSVHSVYEDNQASDWFEIRFDAEGYSYTPEEQKQITDEVKAGLIDRALSKIAIASGLNSAPPPVPNLAPTGASQTALKLYRGCWWFKWCLAAGFALQTADSIWGGRESATSNFKKTTNVWTTDKVRETVIMERPALITFSKMD